MRIAALYLENANFHRRHIPIPIVWKESIASLCRQTEPQRILVVCDNTEAKTLHVMRQTKGSCLHRQQRRPRPQSCPSTDSHAGALSLCMRARRVRCGMNSRRETNMGVRRLCVVVCGKNSSWMKQNVARSKQRSALSRFLRAQMYYTQFLGKWYAPADSNPKCATQCLPL